MTTEAPPEAIHRAKLTWGPMGHAECVDGEFRVGLERCRGRGKERGRVSHWVYRFVVKGRGATYAAAFLDAGCSQ